MQLTEAQLNKLEYQRKMLNLAFQNFDIDYSPKPQEEKPSKKAEYVRNFKKKYPLKSKAHKLVERALKSGELTKMPCEICSSEETVHAHHDDYSKPLTIRWLCREHHIEWHTHTSPEYDPSWENKSD